MHHGDRGSHGGFKRSSQRSIERGCDGRAEKAPVGSVGDAYDNALAESFLDSFKTELIADRVWRTRTQLELAVVEYIGWFNHARLQEALGDILPAEMEALYAPRSEADISLEMKRGSQLTRSPRKPVRLRQAPLSFSRLDGSQWKCATRRAPHDS